MTPQHTLTRRQCLWAGAGLLSGPGVWTAAMLALILFKHRGNVVRLVQGTEPRFERARLLGRWLDRALGRGP